MERRRPLNPNQVDRKYLARLLLELELLYYLKSIDFFSKFRPNEGADAFMQAIAFTNMEIAINPLKMNKDSRPTATKSQFISTNMIFDPKDLRPKINLS